MPEHIFESLAADWRAAEHRMRDLTHPHHYQDPPGSGTQTPASTPASLETQPTKENPMSLATDVEQGYQAVKNELGKFEQALPGLIEQGRKLEANPLAQLAIKAGEHVLNGLIPAEALASVGRIAETALSEALATWAPQQAAQPAPAQQAPAQ